MVHPSASLHLAQLAKLVQDYQHARMLFGVRNSRYRSISAQEQ
jgi:hypothetical protein